MGVVHVTGRLRRDESGATLVLVTIALVVLLGISALTLDLGIGHVEQRRLQNGADAGALGAAQDLPKLAGSTAPAVTDAENLAGQNLPNHLLDWSSIALCPGAKLPKPSSSPCVTFSNDFTQIRVWIPRQTMKTLFAGILGFSSLSTKKAATAEVNVVGGGSGLEPFMMPGNFTEGAFCLDSGGKGNSTQPCSGPITGNFGLLDFSSCTGNNSLDDNIALGADHFYSLQALQGVGDIPDDCTQPGPNTVAPDTGNKTGQETPAMTGAGPFADGGPGRLQRSPSDGGDFSPNWETSVGLDNRPLWEFIPDTTLSGVPDHCQRATFTNLLNSTPSAQQELTMNWALDRCIFEYTCGYTDTTTGPLDPVFNNAAVHYDCTPGTGKRAGAPIPACGGTRCRAPLFTANTNPNSVSGLDVVDLVQSPRFVYVPQVWQTTPNNGNGGPPYEIKAFRAVFIQRTGKNNGPYFEPGPWNSGSPETTAADITSFAFPPPIPGCTPTPTDSCGTMLPGDLGLQQLNIGDNAVVQLVG